MNIAKKHYEVYNYQVLGDKGFIDINNVIMTKPLREYIIYFSSGRTLRCADRHVVIDIEGDELLVKNLSSGDLIKSENDYDEVFDVIDTKKDINMYDLNLDNYHLFYTNGILSHNSNTLANFAARQVLNGYNVVLLTLEMAQDAFAQRFDSIYSLMDINRMYTSDDKKKELIQRLKNVKETENRGELYIKQFPTGEASVRDFKNYLRELMIRDIKPHILYADYINLMKSASKSGDNMYSTIKRIAEELRALSFEFEVPVVSVSQLNREGSFVGFEQLDFTYIAESMGLPATSDFMAIYGVDEDAMIYNGELHYKIVKNRLGGRVGEIDKFFYDSRSLKMYDSTEENMWLDDVEKTGDNEMRQPYVQRNGNERRTR